jgi:hypothetical protein
MVKPSRRVAGPTLEHRTTCRDKEYLQASAAASAHWAFHSIAQQKGIRSQTSMQR